jgi:putative ABC transport system permease protein
VVVSGSRLREQLYTLQEGFRSAIVSVRAHTLRSLLTMFGVIIGIASVICVVTLMEGLNGALTAQFEGLGSTMLTVRAYTPQEDYLRGKVNRLRPTDLEQIRFHIDGIRDLTPFVFANGRGSEVRHGANVARGGLVGSTADFQDVLKLYPRHGRFLTRLDDQGRRRVVVLGADLREDLRLPEDPVGEFVQIGSEWFKVVGVLEPRGKMLGNQDGFLVMPYQTALALSGNSATPDLWISLSVIDAENVEPVRQRVIGLLRSLHNLGADQPNDFKIESQDSIRRQVREVTTVISLVLGGIVGISLIVGGVGIMNIMLVSVTERTREIGIAKALGAPRRYILVQFLIEAMVIAAIGGAVGILFGVALAFGIGKLLAAQLTGFPAPSVPWWAVAGAFTFSALVGMLFGILPANKASNLKPIDALRYE